MRKVYKVFYSELAEHYVEENFVYSTASGRLRRNFITKLLKDFPQGLLLNVGCGGIPLQADNQTVVGVDIAVASLKRAKRLNPKGLFICGDAERLDFLKPSTFPSAVLIETIEHLENPLDCLGGIYKALTPGALLLITCPNWSRKRPYLEYPPIIKRVKVSLPEPDGYLHTAYKPEELYKMCAEVGFECIQKGSFEKELRYWTKLPLIIYQIGERIFGPRKWLDMAYHSFLKLGVRLITFTGISEIIEKVVKNGRRSYIIVRKPYEAS